MRQIVVVSLFTDEEAKTQCSEVHCPRLSIKLWQYDSRALKNYASLPP